MAAPVSGVTLASLWFMNKHGQLRFVSLLVVVCEWSHKENWTKARHTGSVPFISAAMEVEAGGFLELRNLKTPCDMVSYRLHKIKNKYLLSYVSHGKFD